MKTRCGFVSNSSSSSFIVIGKDNLLPPLKPGEKQVYFVGKEGTIDFGWEKRRYSTLADRVNFTVLQAMYMDAETARKTGNKNNHYKENKVLAVIKKHLGYFEVRNLLTLDADWGTPARGKRVGYIDHQSCATENTNIEMFNDDETLKNFLFSKDSYIQGGNDNDED